MGDLEPQRAPSLPRAGIARRAWIGALLGLSLSGCGILNVDPVSKAAANDAGFKACVAEFYLPYAVLAAAVYGSRTATDLSRELMTQGYTQEQRSQYEKLDTLCRAEARRLGDARRGDPDASSPDAAAGTMPLVCTSAWVEPEHFSLWSNDGVLPLKDTMPPDELACETSGAEIPVPLSEVSSAETWQRRFDIERYATTREWRVFVPGFAVEVFSRVRAARPGEPRREYAIVFRGTADSGGWFSDFRVVTALLPIFWDQYRQAEWSSKQIVEQIRSIELREWLATLEFSRRKPLDADEMARMFDREFPYVTAVGHSLGAGLAKHVYYRTKEISKVVGFNPSPIDGSRTTIAVEQRASVMLGRRREAHPEQCVYPGEAQAGSGETSPRAAGSAMTPTQATLFFLHEQGEFLTSVAPCRDGPHWGAEGGPISTCQMVNLTRANKPFSFRSMFREHGMNLLACKLAAVRQKARADRGLDE